MESERTHFFKNAWEVLHKCVQKHERVTKKFLADTTKDILSTTTVKPGSQTATESRLPHFRTDTFVSGLLLVEKQ